MRGKRLLPFYPNPYCKMPGAVRRKAFYIANDDTPYEVFFECFLVNNAKMFHVKHGGFLRLKNRNDCKELRRFERVFE
jgi:hypothetical protein